MMAPSKSASRRTRRGNYALISALSMTVMLAFGALAIDSAYIRVADLQAQAAADAGAQAAMVYLRQFGDIELARAAAVLVIGENTLVGKATLVEEDTDIEFGQWDYTLHEFDEGSSTVNAVRVNIRKTESSPNGTIDLLMMKMFGTSAGSAASHDLAVSALRFREILIVQDVTGSFQQEIGDARTGDLAFLDYMYDHPAPNDKIGMVTFVGAATLWTGLKSVESNYSTIRTQWAKLDWCNRNYSPYNRQPPPTYHNAPQMMDCRTGSPPGPTSYYDSGTSQATGINAALDVLLDPAVSDPYALKTIVLMSDGKPECIPSTTSCNNARAAAGLLAANEAEDNNISIFSVSYNSPFNATQSAYMEALVRGYGAFYETIDSADLPGIMYDIATNVPVALVE